MKRGPLAIACLAVGLIVWWAAQHRQAAAPGVEARLARVAEARPADLVDCVWLRARRPMSILVLGQSNAANHGAERHDGTPSSYVFRESRCFAARDPLPGGTGSGGSIWSRFGPMLSRAAGDRPVMFTVHAVEATTIEDWTSNAAMTAHLARVLEEMSSAGFAPQFIFWQQGEADALARTPTSEYRRRLLALVTGLRDRNVNAPFVLALSTRCGDADRGPIRQAIASVIGTSGILGGPDTDGIGPDLREGCHFTAAGLQRAAELWLEAVLPHVR